jgi:uncharacterized protein YcfJ
MIYTNERKTSMKLTALVAALLVATTAHAEVRFSKDPRQNEPRTLDGQSHSYKPSPLYNVPNQLVRYAPIVNIETMSKLETGVTQRQVCGVTTVPIQKNVPIVEGRYVHPADAALGAVVGAIVGAGVSNGNVGATVIGGAIGAGVATNSNQRVVGYSTQTVGYQQQNTCQILEEPYSRNVIVGYLVTYEDNGEKKTISTTVHPGTHVRLVTTTRTEM